MFSSTYMVHRIQMRPLSTRIIETEASYQDIMTSVDTHKDLKQMKKTVMEENVVFFIYRGCEDTAIIMMNCEGFYMQVCPCPKVLKLKTNPDLVYALCYGI